MLGILIVALLLIGRFYPGTGAEVLGWGARSHEAEAEAEADDLRQMIDAQNELRRRRGLEARSEEQVRAEVDADERELAERAARYRSSREQASLDAEVEQGLARHNARRRRQGLPELTPEDYRRSLSGGDGGA